MATKYTFKEYQTPFTSVLHTNYAPSSAEAQQIHSILREPQEELLYLNDDIPRLQRILDSLIRRRDAIQTFVDTHLALVAPFRRLPNDMIAEIFLRCLPSDRNPIGSLTEAPLSLTAVTRTLREVALSTPRLWNALHVFVPAYRDVGHSFHRSEFVLKRQREGVELWLKRSGSLPLSISASMSAFISPTMIVQLPSPLEHSSPMCTQFEHIDSFFRAIVSFSSRWKHITLRLPPDYVDRMNILSKKLKADYAPLLETADIFYDGNSALWPRPSFRAQPVIPLDEVICHATSLQSLTIHTYNRQFHMLQLPFKTLKVLTIIPYGRTTRLTVSQTLDVLSNLPNLEYCTLGVSSAPRTSDPDDFTVALPKLHTLTVDLSISSSPGFPMPVVVGADTTEETEELFKRMHAPSLRKLTFTSVEPGIDYIPFMPLLINSQCNLQDLSIRLHSLAPGALVSCLRRLPTLTSLTVTHIVNDTLVTRLTPSFINPSPLCPRLENVVFAECDRLFKNALLDFISSKRPTLEHPGVSPLKSLSVGFRIDYPTSYIPDERVGMEDDEIMPQIEKFREEGMVINWT